MKTLVRTEFFKLTTTRTIRFLVLGGLAVAVLLGTVTSTTAGQEGNASRGAAAHLANVLGVSAMPGFVMLILGVLATAGEYQHRTITQTFLATPARGRVLAAKLAAVSVAGLAVTVAMMGAALLAAAPHVLADGATLHFLDAEVGRTVAGTVAAGALFGAAGVGIGALFRSQVASLVAVAAWVVVAEAVLGTVLGVEATRWFPAKAASYLAGSDVPGLSLAGAAGLLTGYCLAIAAAASKLTLSRDVT